jgi:hypothetical protein
MNVRLRHDMNFTAGIYYNDHLRMNNYHLRLWMTTTTKNSEDQNTAFERLKYFVYAQLDSTVFINSQLQTQCQRFVDAGIDITTMPGDPVDQLIGIMLYFKLNAITEGRMDIVETELSSTLGDDITYLHSDFENSLGFDQPAWWAAADLIHSDIHPAESDKIVSLSHNALWRDLDLAWAESLPEGDTGNVVVFANFKQPNETE